MFQKALHRIRASAEVDARFLYYALLDAGGQDKFSALFTGSTIKHLPKEKLRLLSVALPAKEMQGRIADCLTAYDDVIDVNRRRMALLERAARELYQEWFVRLRFPGYEHTEVSGTIPQGWERALLGSCAKFLSGGTPSKARPDFWSGEIPWVSSGELTGMRIRRTTLCVSDEGADQGSRIVPANTILAVVRGMSLAKDFRIGLTSRVVTFNQDLKAIVPRDGLPSLFLFHSLDAQRDAIRDQAGEASHGTKKLDSDVLASVPVLIPTPAVLDAFVQRVKPVHMQWDTLDRQNQQLLTARNLLLPRLMRGELLT